MMILPREINLQEDFTPDYQIVIKVGVQNGFNEIRKIISSSQSKYKIIPRALGNNSDGCNRWPMGMIFLYLLGKFLCYVYLS
mgnify:FL=1